MREYWGRELAVNRGTNNFDRIRYDYFRDDTVIREALKAGSIDLRAENQAKAWALDYDTPAVREGRLIKRTFDHDRPTGMQGFAMNTRRPVFQDPRVRQALAFAFDFEWSNRNLFFGQYARTESYFSNSELAATGLPARRSAGSSIPGAGRSRRRCSPRSTARPGPTAAAGRATTCAGRSRCSRSRAGRCATCAW